MGGDDESSQMGYQHCADLMLTCPSRLNSMPSSDGKIAPMTMSAVYGGSGWDPVGSLSQAGDFASVVSSVVPQNHDISSSDHMNLAHMLPKIPMFGNGSLPDFVHPFGLSSGGGLQNFSAPFTQSFGLNQNEIDGKPLSNSVQVDGDCSVSEGRTVGVSPDGKRKREVDSSPLLNKNAEGEPTKEHLKETSGSKSDGKRQKTENNSAGNSPAKQTGKEVKENSQDDEVPKQNYIHVRARRGQATNSHSLAERVRREKISERMRLLQELVPGCNKITGKAVMLDEIINYVQSLQQQVEFLSMKLATVNPELNIDIGRLLSKDIFNPRGNTTPIHGFDHGLNFPHGFSPGIQGNLSTLPNAASQYHMPQAVWDSDLQNLLHMGFDPNPALGSLGPNGSSKGEI